MASCLWRAYASRRVWGDVGFRSSDSRSHLPDFPRFSGTGGRPRGIEPLRTALAQHHRQRRDCRKVGSAPRGSICKRAIAVLSAPRPTRLSSGLEIPRRAGRLAPCGHRDSSLYRKTSLDQSGLRNPEAVALLQILPPEASSGWARLCHNLARPDVGPTRRRAKRALPAPAIRRTCGGTPRRFAPVRRLRSRLRAAWRRS